MAVRVAEQVDLLETAEPLLTELLAHSSIQHTLAENGKVAEGGYLCATTSTGLPYLIAYIGRLDATKADDRLAFSQEKARRLAANLEHVLSRQSENKELKLFPGAVRAHRLILSFSGLPGHLDELYMLILAVRIGAMSAAVARATLATYPNDYATEGVIETFLAAA